MGSKHQKQHTLEMSQLQGQIAALQVKANENNASSGRTEAMNITLNNELQIKKDEASALALQLEEVKVNYEEADKEREKLRGDLISIKSLFSEKNSKFVKEVEFLQQQLEKSNAKIQEVVQECVQLREKLKET